MIDNVSFNSWKKLSDYYEIRSSITIDNIEFKIKEKFWIYITYFIIILSFIDFYSYMLHKYIRNK